MKEFSVFAEGDKTSPTKRLETVYLPRKPLPDDIVTMGKAEHTQAEKKVATKKVSHAALEAVQKCFDEFNVTLNRNSGVIFLNRKCQYIHAVNAIIPDLTSLPGNFDDICKAEIGEDLNNSRLLAKAYKLAKIPFSEVIDHFCQDAEKARISLPTEAEWMKIDKAIYFGSNGGVFKSNFSQQSVRVFMSDSKIYKYNAYTKDYTQYLAKWPNLYLALIREPLGRDYKFDAFCWLGENGLLPYEGLDAVDWDSLYSDDDISIGFGRRSKPRQNSSTAPAADNGNEISEEEATAWFCSADYRRNGDDPYVLSMLTDHNQGHWDLADNTQDNSGIAVKLTTPVYARNPWLDVKWDSTIGIDFGTKSTVVSRLGDTGGISIVAVGATGGAYGEDINENPTILELLDFERFWKAYRSNKGRPETSWLDLSASWSAKRDLDESNAVNFYSFINTLKQWAAAKDEWLYPKAAKDAGHDIKIKPFTRLAEEDFNPIEIYAYYIGMAINNMRDKAIYPHYLLSFPVNYNDDVTTKIVSSFRQGLLRSLPGALVRDKSFRNQFTVEKYASEPAAYAVCALETYGFSPKDEEDKYYYSIFDFGGGTTDFDYGIWRGADENEKEMASYVIEHFNASGDQFLGGENILANMAFQVFSKEENQKELRKKEVKFTHTLDDKSDIPGNRGNIDDISQWARLNMYKMQEELRPIWHAESGYEDTFKDGKRQITLFNNVGDQVTDCTITINIEELNKYIENRIRRGITHFFEGMQQELGHRENLEQIHIFLAGNSCRAKIVKTIFDEECKRYCATHRKEEDFFDIYPPLGSPECFTKLERRNVPFNKNDPYFPTGKTGVAIGLIMARPGHDVLVKGAREEGRQVGFRFTIGREERRAFTPIIPLNTPVASDDYEGWVAFGKKALTSSFEILYSSAPGAVQGKVAVSECRRKKVLLPQAYPEASIGVRPISPDSIEVGLFTDGPAPLITQEVSFK